MNPALQLCLAAAARCVQPIAYDFTQVSTIVEVQYKVHALKRQKIFTPN